MYVIEPRHLKPRKKPKKVSTKVVLCIFTVIIGILLSTTYSFMAVHAALPQIEPITRELPDITVQKVAIDWPDFGHAAVGADGYGVLASSGATKQVPTASIAKIITALAVLKKKPMEKGQAGGKLHLTEKDVALYQAYIEKNGSVVAVSDGEVITEYQALQALLLPSANNIADSLADWAFGSVPAYTRYANTMLVEYGIKQTTITDASGFAPSTLSTAEDLVRIGILALQDPIIGEIVGQREANIPVAGKIRNVNKLLATHDIVGIKTGNTDEAGGCLLFAARRIINDKPVTIVGAVMGAPTREKVFSATLPIMESAFKGFGNVKALSVDTVVGSYQAPWGEAVDITADKDVSVFGWRGVYDKPQVVIQKSDPTARTGTIVGSVQYRSGSNSFSTPLKIAADLKPPNMIWRIRHYLE